MKTVAFNGKEAVSGATTRREVLATALRQVTRVFKPKGHPERRFFEGPGEMAVGVEAKDSVQTSRRKFMKWGMVGVAAAAIAFSPLGKGLINIANPFSAETAYAREAGEVFEKQTGGIETPAVLTSEAIDQMRKKATNFFVDWSETSEYGKIALVTCDEWNFYVAYSFDEQSRTYNYVTDLGGFFPSTIKLAGGKIYDKRVIYTELNGVVDTYRNADGGFWAINIVNKETRKNKSNPERVIRFLKPASEITLERGKNLKAFAYLKDEDGFWKIDIDLTARRKPVGVITQLPEEEARKKLPQCFASGGSGSSSSMAKSGDSKK